SDFGLARQAAAQHMTQAGAVLGTPSYMAPEQAEGSPDVGPKADVWALGVILYRLLTGKVPFESKSMVELLHQICTAEPVPPAKLCGEVPAALEALCLECLRKQPGDRPTAADLAARLEATLAKGREEATVPLTPRWRRGRVAIVVGVTLLALAGL